jgi:hypothetical protein
MPFVRTSSANLLSLATLKNSSTVKTLGSRSSGIFGSM